MTLRANSCLALITGSVLLGTAWADGPKTTDFGKREFDANCASCHGMDGKGKGPLVPFLLSLIHI